MASHLVSAHPRSIFSHLDAHGKPVYRVVTVPEHPRKNPDKSHLRAKKS